MTTEISEERIEKVKEILKEAGYTDEQIAAFDKAIRKLAVQYPVAADNGIYWLEGKGGTKYLKPAWLRAWAKVTDAEERVRGYFKNRTFPDEIEKLERRGDLKPESNPEITDHWDGKIIAEYPRQAHLYFASGRSCLTSYGRFRLAVTAEEDGGKLVALSGRVDHGWWDIYHWTEGKTFLLPGIGRVDDAQMEKLKKAGAKDYRLESWWSQAVSAALYVGAHGKAVKSKTRVQWGPVLYAEDGRKLK